MKNESINDGGPFSVDMDNVNFNMDVCEKLTLSMAELPSFLTQIMPELPLLSGGWERTVTFTAKEQESRALVACCIDSSCAQNEGRKFTIEIKTRWITGGEISKEQRHRITKNSTILGLLFRGIKQDEYTQSKESVFFAARVSLHIQTIEEGKKLATSDAPLGWPYALECQGKQLRDYFAGQALASVALHAQQDQWAKGGSEWRDAVASESYKLADAMITARNQHQ